MLDLEPIKARLDAATPGPFLWNGRELFSQSPTKAAGLNQKMSIPLDGAWATEFDLDLIASAPTDIAALVEEVERVTADNAALLLALDDDHDDDCPEINNDCSHRCYCKHPNRVLAAMNSHSVGAPLLARLERLEAVTEAAVLMYEVLGDTRRCVCMDASDQEKLVAARKGYRKALDQAVGS